jgi:hypothetical protein
MFAQTQEQIQSAAALDMGWDLSPDELAAMQQAVVPEAYYAYQSGSYMGFGAVQFNALDPKTWTEEQKKNFILNYEALRQHLLKQPRPAIKGFAGFGDILSDIASGVNSVASILKPGVDMYSSINNMLHPPTPAAPSAIAGGVQPGAPVPPPMPKPTLQQAQGLMQYLPWVAGIVVLLGAAYIIFKPKGKIV